MKFHDILLITCTLLFGYSVAAQNHYVPLFSGMSAGEDSKSLVFKLDNNAKTLQYQTYRDSFWATYHFNKSGSLTQKKNFSRENPPTSSRLDGSEEITIVNNTEILHSEILPSALKRVLSNSNNELFFIHQIDLDADEDQDYIIIEKSPDAWVDYYLYIYRNDGNIYCRSKMGIPLQGDLDLLVVSKIVLSKIPVLILFSKQDQDSRRVSFVY